MKIETELMRGAGPVAVLKLLERGEKYGYELVQALSRESDGVLAMGQSTLYPMLYNLEAIVRASGLPEALRGRIIETVKRTRLSRREKAEIAGELVAHFADGLEDGTAEQELLSDFGDARTTAKLMRRAKLRCRALPRRAMRRTGQVLAVLVIVYIGAAIYYAGGRPQVTVDYLARMNAAVKAVPEGDRAWPVYREALLRLDRPVMRELLAMEGIDPGGEAWEEAARYVQDHEAALATARRAAAMGSLGFVLRTSIAAEDRALWPDESAAQEGAKSFGLMRLDSPDTALVAVRLPPCRIRTDQRPSASAGSTGGPESIRTKLPTETGSCGIQRRCRDSYRFLIVVREGVATSSRGSALVIQWQGSGVLMEVPVV